MDMPKLPKTKNKIQNIVIVVAITYVFGTSATAFFAPELIQDEKGNFSEFQKLVLDNSNLLTVVVISGSIAAIALDKRDSKMEEFITILIENLRKSKPADESSTPGGQPS